MLEVRWIDATSAMLRSPLQRRPTCNGGQVHMCTDGMLRCGIHAMRTSGMAIKAVACAVGLQPFGALQ